MNQWTNWEAGFSTRSVRQLRDVTIELVEVVLSMWSLPRCYKQDKSRIELAVRQSSTSKDVNTEIEESTAFEAVTRQRLVNA
jgi:hypothetical protein